MIIFDVKWVFSCLFVKFTVLVNRIFPLGQVGSQCFLGFHSSKDALAATL